MDNINKYKRQRFWLRLLFIAIAYLIPLIVMGFKFDFFTFREAEIKVSGLFLIVSIMLLFQFKKEVYTWIESWEFSLLKVVLLGLAKVWAFILALGVIALARYGIDNIEFIIGWVAIPQIISYLFVKPFSEQADYKVKKEIRKLEIKEALQEDRAAVQ
jgi:hypothetical protein